MNFSVPILSCAEAAELERRVLGGDEMREWDAMRRAGHAVGDAVITDALELAPLPRSPRILVLVGKGHNGGDALIAARRLLEGCPAGQGRVEVLFVLGERCLRPLAARAWRELVHAGGARVRVIAEAAMAGRYDVVLDGIFGFNFRAPADAAVARVITAANALDVGLRAAVDVPSAGLFQADFTYATGSVKVPAVGAPAAGRVRYLDLGFFAGAYAPGSDRVLVREVLAPLARLRSPQSDKRTYGHLLVLGGSQSYPGAVLMTVLAALRSGVGLVTAFVPESLVPAFAARAPEAMWVGCPVTPEGGVALEAESLIRRRLDRAQAWVIGPGLGRELETQALVASVLKQSAVPVVLDADALQAELIGLGSAPRILTPHAGEFARISGGRTLQEMARSPGNTVVLKGSVTQVAAGETVAHSFFGGPVLARGGSGDVLAGLIGGLLAQRPQDPTVAAARGVVWHGLAADRLARQRGQVAVVTTDLLDQLGPVLRETSG
jgi:NAD(P)H-hydrate epimerase